MSTITTETQTHATVEDVLRDYRIHTTNAGNEEVSADGTNEELSNPPDWTTDQYRVPAYRPLNTNVDLEARGGSGRNPAEVVFVFLMLNGCRINSNIANLWNATGAKLTGKSDWGYKIGGEW